ncbi:hypothetical protein [Caballeronia sp. dw_276]|jgi:hypothetical protein|nr:hypothetical protein [Caballeronia sp. dw_276]
MRRNSDLGKAIRRPREFPEGLPRGYVAKIFKGMDEVGWAILPLLQE